MTTYIFPERAVTQPELPRTVLGVILPSAPQTDVSDSPGPSAVVVEWPIVRPGGQYYVQCDDPKIRLRWHKTFETAQKIADRVNRRSQR